MFTSFRSGTLSAERGPGALPLKSPHVLSLDRVLVAPSITSTTAVLIGLIHDLSEAAAAESAAPFDSKVQNGPRPIGGRRG